MNKEHKKEGAPVPEKPTPKRLPKAIISKLEEMPAGILKSFTTDLVHAKEYSRRKGISHTAVYQAFKEGMIKKSDIYEICGFHYWSWTKYKDLPFRKYNNK